MVSFYETHGASLVAQVAKKLLSRVRLSDSMDCSLPGSSVHGIFQARILEWVAISFFRGSSQPRDWPQVSRIVGRRFTIWVTREDGKESASNAGDLSSISGSGRSPREGNCSSLQYSCLENPMNRVA